MSVEIHYVFVNVILQPVLRFAGWYPVLYRCRVRNVLSSNLSMLSLCSFQKIAIHMTVLNSILPHSLWLFGCSFYALLDTSFVIFIFYLHDNVIAQDGTLPGVTFEENSSFFLFNERGADVSFVTVHQEKAPC